MKFRLKRLSFYLMATFFSLIPSSAWSFSKTLKTEDIPKVMEQFFRYHVEEKTLNAELVRRTFKMYLLQFDPDKNYLLQNEVDPYFRMSNRKAEKIASKMQRGDYSDFYELEDLIKKSIKRAKSLRENLSVWIQGSFEGVSLKPSDSHPRNDAQIEKRFQKKLLRFYLQHQRYAKMESEERKERLVFLFEQKLEEKEGLYLGFDEEGNSFSAKQYEHMVSVRILKAFAKSLDAHSSYFSADEAKEVRFHLEKQFEGFGIVLGESIDGIFIAKVIPGSPAEKSGNIFEKDFVVELDGESTEEMSFERVLSRLKKRTNPRLILGLQRPESSLSEVFYVSLEKAPIAMEQERIQTKYVPFGSGVIGSIILRSFYDNGKNVTSEKDVQKSLDYLKAQGPIKGLILDLRENGGGFLSQAVKVAGLFMSSGVVVISKYGKNEMHYFRSVDPRKSYDGPMIILTSKISASAAEIVAQALQDYGIALIAGDSRTFGKGSIQYQTITSSDAEIYFKVTIGKYYTVSGKTTQMKGVIADILIPTSFAPFEIGEKYLQHPLKPDEVASAYQDRLHDIDPRIRVWLKEHYVPYMQKKLTIYRDMLPHLKKNSADRIRKNPDYQAFLENQKNIKKRLNGDSSVSVDLQKNFGQEDLQLLEAFNVMRDMIYLQSKNLKTQKAA